MRSITRLTAVATAALAALASSLVLGGISSAGATSPAPNLKPKLLAISDLPAGWTVESTSAGNGNGLGRSACLAGLQPAPKQKAEQATILFDQNGTTPLLGETLAIGKTVFARWKTINAHLAACKTLTFHQDGSTDKGTIGSMSFPKVGTTSSAYSITVPISGVSVGIDLVLFTTGKYAGVVEYGGELGAPNITQLEQFVNQAIGKAGGQSSV